MLKYYSHNNALSSKALVRTFSVEKLFLETAQNSQKNTCARDSFLIELQD